MVPPRNPKVFFGTLSLLMVMGILACTLWPFDPSPTNEVRWVEGSEGVRFSGNGLVLSLEPLGKDASKNSSCAVEIWLQPADTRSVSTILDFYKPDNPDQFLLRQYLDGLIISHDYRNSDGKIKRTKIDLDHGLFERKLTLVTVSFSEKGTSLYLDGQIKQTYPNFRVYSSELTGQIILGTAPLNSETWRGEMRGLAFYARDLSSEAVEKHYREWREPGGFSRAIEDVPFMGKYSFKEGQGEVIHAAGAAPNLIIPEHYFVPHQALLTAPWNEFDPGWEDWPDVLRNILGFMPFGVLLCAYLRFTPCRSQAILMSTLAGLALSLGIETVQAFLPQRVSSLTDVLTNTFGSGLGALLLAYVRKRGIFRSWPWKELG